MNYIFRLCKHNLYILWYEYNNFLTQDWFRVNSAEDLIRIVDPVLASACSLPETYVHSLIPVSSYLHNYINLRMFYKIVFLSIYQNVGNNNNNNIYLKSNIQCI